MTRWVKVRDVHVDADAVQSVSRKTQRIYLIDSAVLELESGAHLTLGLQPLGDEDHSVRAGLSATEPEVRTSWWGSPPKRPRFGRKRQAKYDGRMAEIAANRAEQRAFDREYELARRDFADAQYDAIVWTITG